MSCLAEPPTLPSEMAEMTRDLMAHHKTTPPGTKTARPGYCVDVAHGYADANKHVVYDHFGLMQAAAAMTSEVHLKNTDAHYNSTFGFSESDRKRGIIDIPAVRAFYEQHAAELPVKTLIGYLEIGGPKLGRDYSDGQLEAMLRESLQYLRQTWESKNPAEVRPVAAAAAPARVEPHRVDPMPTQPLLPSSKSPRRSCAPICSTSSITSPA